MSDAAELEQPYLELFKHIIKYLDDPTTDGLIFASRIRTIAERGFNVGMVRSGLSWLTKHGFLNIVQESSQNGTCWELSSKGTAVAYQLIALANLPITTGSNVPTADSVPITFHDKPLTFHGTPLVWSGQMPTDLNAPTPDSRQSEANIPPNLFRDIDHSSAEFKDGGLSR